MRSTPGDAVRTARILLLCVAVLLAAGCSARPGTVEGIASIDGAPAAGAEVQAFAKAGAERSGTPFITTTARDDGSFALSLPPGNYFLVARKSVRRDGRERTYKGEFPGNPVAVRDGGATRGIAVPLIEMSSGGFAPRAGTGVTGTVFAGGRAVPGAYVYAYPDNVGTVRGPAYAAFARTGDGGGFRLPLREGAFRIVVRDKGGENETGAMSVAGKSGGDAGIRVDLSAGTTVDVGRISLHSPEEAKRRRRAAAGGLEEAAAEIRGTVTRDDGSPAPGVRVMAYADPRMIGRPFAVSGPTDAAGVFLLRLPKPGKYYLGARSELGGPVSPGEWVGAYDGAPDHGLTLGLGERRTEIRIGVVEKW
ncbi:MAG: carboxypeptidase-like regulatory domain-containing protein [Desulfobacteria bacterium]